MNHPINMAYHESRMAELRREADAARLQRSIAASRDRSSRFSFRIVSALRAAVAPPA